MRTRRFASSTTSSARSSPRMRSLTLATARDAIRAPEHCQRPGRAGAHRGWAGAHRERVDGTRRPVYSGRSRPMATPSVDASDRRIARVERVLDLGALALGMAILLLVPGARVALQAP